MSHILDTKINLYFQRSHFHCMFNDIGFLVDITPKSNASIFIKLYLGRAWPQEDLKKNCER